MTARQRATYVALAIWLVGLGVAAALIARTQFTADLSAFLPRSPSAAQKVLVEQLRDGVVARLILVGIEGASEVKLAALSKDLARRLEADTHFVAVHNGEDRTLARDREFLWSHRYLLSSAVTPARFSEEGLHRALEDDVELLGSPAGALTKRILADDPSGELLQIIGRLAPGSQPPKRLGVWFAASGSRALLVLETRAPGFDIDAQEAALGILEHAFGDARTAEDAPGASLVASGPGVISVHTRERIKRDASRLSFVATLLVASVLLLVYRSLPVLILALLPVGSGALAGIAAVSLGFGSVHGITLGFGATLIGEAVDYAIYLFTQTAPGSPPELTLPRIWPTLRLGVLTSVCGFCALLFSSFTGLAQLGLFSIAGLVVAVSVTRWVLPGLMPRSFTAAGSSLLRPAVALLAPRGRRWRQALLVLVVAALGVILTKPGSLWDERLSSLSPTTAADQQLDEGLRQDIAAPDVGSLLVIRAPGQQEALQAAEALATSLDALVARRVLSGYDSPADVLPSARAQSERQAALPEPGVLGARLARALDGEPFRVDLFKPFLADIAAAREQPLMDRASLEGTSLALKLDSLLVREDGQWMAMLPLHGVSDPAALRTALTERDLPGVVLLDLKTESDALYHTYLREAQLLSLAGCLAIVALLGLSLGRVHRCLQVLAPLASAVVVTTALLVLCGEALTIFHLVGLLLVVAVGSNYALFFERQESGAQREERTVASLVLANVCTVIGFGTLSFSRIPVLHGIGLTVALGAVLCLVFAALGCLPLRRTAESAESAESAELAESG